VVGRTRRQRPANTCRPGASSTRIEPGRGELWRWGRGGAFRGCGRCRARPSACASEQFDHPPGARCRCRPAGPDRRARRAGAGDPPPRLRFRRRGGGTSARSQDLGMGPGENRQLRGRRQRRVRRATRREPGQRRRPTDGFVAVKLGPAVEHLEQGLGARGRGPSAQDTPSSPSLRRRSARPGVDQDAARGANTRGLALAPSTLRQPRRRSAPWRASNIRIRQAASDPPKAAK